MGYHSIEALPITRFLAVLRKTADKDARYSGLPRGPTFATIVDVDDPQERGRVRVLFDAHNYEQVPQAEGADLGSREGSGQQLSHWINTCPAFKGKSPPGLKNKRVTIMLPHSQYQYAVLNDVVFDPENLTEAAASELEIPNNSSMVRLPIYPSGELPPPCKENHGCTVIEEDGPMESDWACICLKRDGEYHWVRHADLSHGHAGGNDGSQAPDSLGNRQNPIMMGTVGDGAFPTTAKQFKQNSSYTTKPQGNPKGDRAHWYPPPMSTLTYTPGEDFDLINPDPNIALEAVRGIANFPDLNFSIAGFSASLDVNIPTVLQTDAISALTKAQGLLATAQGAINDPVGFITGAAVSAAQGFIGDTVSNLAGQATGAIGGVVGQAAQGVVNQAAGAVTGAITGAAQGVVNQAAGAVTGAAQGLVDQAAGAVTGAITGAAQGVVNQAAGAVTGAAQGLVDQAAGAVTGAAQGLADQAGDLAEGIVEGAVSKYIPPAMLSSLSNISNVGGFLNTVASSALTKAFSGPLAGLKSLASSATSALGSAVSSVAGSAVGSAVASAGTAAVNSAISEAQSITSSFLS